MAAPLATADIEATEFTMAGDGQGSKADLAGQNSSAGCAAFICSMIQRLICGSESDSGIGGWWSQRQCGSRVS